MLTPWRWWILAAAAPICLLASRLTLDLWGDEVYTLYHFAAQPVSRIVTDYSAPNNHILYSLVLHPLAVSTQAEPLLRLPSLLFAVATLALVFDTARRLLGLTCAVAATLALGLNVMFLTHAMQLRGYGPSMLLAAWLIRLALPRDNGLPALRGAGQSPRHAILVALVGAAFLYVLPTNALFLAPLAVAAVVMALVKGGARAAFRTLPGWLAAWPVALALYWPVLDQVRAASGGAGGPLPLRALWQLVGNVYWAAGHDLLPLLIALPVVVYRVIRARPRRQPGNGPPAVEAGAPIALAAVSLVSLVGPFVACWLLGVTPFVRTFCPLLPALALVVGWYVGVVVGDSAALFRAADTRPALGWVAIALIFAVLLPPVLRYPSKLDAVRSVRFAQDGYYNYYAADFEPSRVARYLRESIKPDEDFIVLYAKGDHYNLVHYLAREGLPLPPRRLRETAPGRARARIYLVAPALAKWDELAELSGMAPAELRAFPLVERVGYYRIYASPEPVEIRLREFGTAAEARGGGRGQPPRGSKIRPRLSLAAFFRRLPPPCHRRDGGRK